MCNNNLPIGVFDSGVGGLTVVREIIRNLPGEKILYYGDTARVPYGNKSPDTIIRYSKQIVDFLISKGVKAIVIACNTASSLALDAVRQITDIPIIGVVEPGAKAAVNTTQTKRIGVIGTVATVKSGIYERYIKELMPDATVFAKACPLFVYLAEEGMIDDSVTVEMIHRYLDDMINKDDIDTLILGCTHYPLLRKVIAREMGCVFASYPDDKKSAFSEDAQQDVRIKLVNPAYTTAMELKTLLMEKGLEASEINEAIEHEYYVSDGPESFCAFASQILKADVINTKLTVL